ncbi:MAG: hypothetical protein K2X39_10535, partial [Silvanigrellaceae bacterium]|nr:hypothetical protein [Silvanigrellaceae bacterium]
MSFLFILCAFPARAEDVAQSAGAGNHETHRKKIKEIFVEGNKTVNSDAILGFMQNKVGDEFNKSEVSKDIRRIFESHYFTNVQIDFFEKQ